MKSKYRLNTLISPNMAVLLKAHAAYKNFTLGEAIEDLLKEPLKRVRISGNQLDLDLGKIHVLEQEIMTEYSQGKINPITNKKELKNHLKEIQQAVHSDNAHISL